MIRIFNVYYPARTLVLLTGEVLVVGFSFLVAAVLQFGQDSYLVLSYELGIYKILAITALIVLCSYYFDLYAPQLLTSKGETWFRLLMVLGTSSFVLAGVGYAFPGFMLGQHADVFGLVILTIGLLLWRGGYAWLLRQPYFSERVYVLGSGERAQTLVDALRSRKDLGMEVVGWAGAIGNGGSDRDSLAAAVRGLMDKDRRVDRVVVALSDRRNILPVRELLDLRLNAIIVEDATSLLEKISGRIEIDSLHPSALIYSEGFRLGTGFLFARRVVSFCVAAAVLLITAPLVPIIMFLVKVTSRGPVFFRQKRVGRRGELFTLYKFRTMRQDAEANGAVWAGKNDPRVTIVGRFLRKTRLDELPQLWNVLVGNMGFVGPRPERPEFVAWLTEKIPYYNLRHIIRPGLTGWAQVRYQYGASVEETKEKLQYDLYYIKQMSLSLDLLIIFETLKTIVLGRGAQ